MVKKNESPVPRGPEKSPEHRAPRKDRPVNNRPANKPSSPIASFLKELMNRPVEVKTKKGEFIVGILRGFDRHVNLIIEKQTAPGQESTTKMLIRGDSIEIVRPR